MTAPYIPPKDADLVNWGDNFATLITAAPATYGLDASDALAIQTAFDTFDAAYTIAINPATRTTPSIADKNAAKVAFVGLARTYASQIRLDPGVTNMDKLDLGLNLPNNSPAPIPAPLTWPLLDLPTAGPGLHELRYADSATPASRAKPANATAMLLFRGIGTAVITDPEACTFLAAVTKQPYQSTFDPADAGKIATYFARWQVRNGGLGPWSAGQSMTIAF